MSKPRLRPMLDQASQARLGEKLRSMYDRLPDAPLPEDLRVLISVLEQLRAPEGPARIPARRAPRMRAAVASPTRRVAARLG